MSCVFQNIDPTLPHRQASMYCELPPPLVGAGDDILAGWRGDGGSIFRKTPDTALYSLCKYLYHHEGIYFHQLLAALKKRRKSPNLPKGLEPPANQVSNKGAPLLKGARPPERKALHSNQHLLTISTLQLNFPPPPHMAWDLLLLPAPTADPSSLLTPRPWGDHIPLPPF
jgi:hypothetical protein